MKIFQIISHFFVSDNVYYENLALLETIMQAIEFDALVDKGMIHVPPELVAWQSRAVRVILLAANNPMIGQEGERSENDALREQAVLRARALLNHPVGRYLNAARLDTRGFRFDREEANER